MKIIATIGEISIIPIGGMIALKGAIIVLYIFIIVKSGSFFVLKIGIQLKSTTTIIIKYIILNKIDNMYEIIIFPFKMYEKFYNIRNYFFQQEYSL